MKLRWEHWLYGLGKAVIGGVSATAAAYLGTLVGNQIDNKIPVMNWQSLGFVIVFSSLTNLFFYLQKSPLPDDGDETKTP